MTGGRARFRPSGFFHLRTPLLAFDELLDWDHGLTAAAVPDEPARLKIALAADRAVQRRRLETLVARPDIRDALFVASPDLIESIGVWLEHPEGERGQRVERALVKYVSRMAGRATPFGLFAGTSVGRIGTVTRLVVDRRDQSTRHSRLNRRVVPSLTSAHNVGSRSLGLYRFLCDLQGQGLAVGRAGIGERSSPRHSCRA